MAAVCTIDPSVGDESDTVVINKHSGTISQLSKFLSSTADDLFTGWSPIFSSCKPFVLRFEGMPYSRYAIISMQLLSVSFMDRNLSYIKIFDFLILCDNSFDSGIMTLFSIMNFDGSKLVISATEVILNFTTGSYVQFGKQKYI